MAFTDETGAVATPAGLSVRAQPPGGVAAVTGLSVVNDAAGSYYVDLPVTAAGTWTALWAWTGPVRSVQVQSFDAIATGVV
jgi:hypothetical protein